MARGKCIDHFREERQTLNDLVMKHANTGIKRFYNLDAQAYEPGTLDHKTKELLGLVASLVLRCDDCVLYHLIQCKKEGLKTEELTEALNIGLIVGGSIIIPHLRKAYKAWEELSTSAPSP
jgi:AhpD family alkylhydroperoxidase